MKPPPLSPTFLPNLSRVLSAVLLTLAALVCLSFSLLTIDRAGQHWAVTFRPAVLAFIARGNPYTYNASFVNPPWALIPLVPLALLPAGVGQVLIAALTLISLYVAARRLGASPLAAALLLLLPATVYLYANINLEGLVALGLLLPPPLGLLLVMVKPQLGIGAALFWLGRAWQRGGLVHVLFVAAPLAVMGLWSVLVFGPWFITTNAGRLTAMPWTLSLWPWSAPVGLLLIGLALRRRWLGLAVFGGALLAPYMAFYSWPVAILGLLSRPRWAAVALVALAVVSLFYFQP